MKRSFKLRKTLHDGKMQGKAFEKSFINYVIRENEDCEIECF